MSGERRYRWATYFQALHATGASTSTGASTGATALVWFSDWGYSTGSDSTAIRDGTTDVQKWTGEIGSYTGIASVINSTGLNMPSSHCYRWEYGSPSSDFMVLVATNWTPPTATESQYWRWYYRSAVANSQNLGQAHPFQASTLDWVFQFRTPSSGTQLASFTYGNQAYPDDKFYLTIDTSATYRFEMQFDRTASTAAKVDLLVYTSSDGLYADGNSWLNDIGQSLYARNLDLAVSDNAFTNFEIGNNDPGTTGAGFEYAGAMAVRVSATTSDFIGAYPTTEEA